MVENEKYKYSQMQRVQMRALPALYEKCLKIVVEEYSIREIMQLPDDMVDDIERYFNEHQYCIICLEPNQKINGNGNGQCKMCRRRYKKSSLLNIL